MSLLSPRVGIVAAPSGLTPIDELYGKLTVAAAVFFVSLEAAYFALAGLPSIGKPWIDGTHFLIGRDFINEGWQCRAEPKEDQRDHPGVD